MPRTALALLRDELIEILARNDIKLYRMTQKGADRLAAHAADRDTYVASPPIDRCWLRQS